ncbi:flagellar hook-length control protein FliK [Xanthomonas sp. AM6]|uniref:flagellar hook-length control protein FliK n=1 Tax=Xanthomonas sp. AM6 TaxID=2982531 RepID=UPI0021DB14C0|nr:flagellar hook-length control protein FliK [Xanthomonas sp. AM6]UYB50503.1 flagellar hook-length control protein FliK [Xanthomonas sp. AM6]
MNNALSALGGNGRASLPGGGADAQGQDRSGGQDFARLLGNDGPAAAPKPAPKPAAKSPQAAADKDAADKRPEAADDKASEPARSAQAGTQAARDNAKGSEETKAPAKDAKTTDAKQDEDTEEDAGWPPAGLAGIGLGLLPALGAALPAASAGPLGAAAGLAIGVAGAAAKGVAALLGGDAPALPGTAPAGAAGAAAATPGAAGASAAVAAGSFGGMLAQVAGAAAQAVGGGDAAAPVAALAALASAVADKAGDNGGAAAGTGTDPINLVASPGIQAPTRTADSAAPFTGSPTPTPQLHGDNFDDAMGARVSWLADQKIGHAHIKLSPAELGPVEVRLHLSGDQVNASFSSAQADVRQALENSLPRLREMLGQHGFQLGQADVGQQHQQPAQNAPQGAVAGGSDAAGDDVLGSVGIPSVVLRQRGLLDAYA